MSNIKGRLVLLVVAGTLVLSACGGDDEPTSNSTNNDGTPSDESSSTEEPQPENDCTPAVSATLPDTLDAESCWAAYGATDPVIIGDTVFALVSPDAAGPSGAPYSTDATAPAEETTPPTGADGEPLPSLVAYEADGGKEIWSSDPLTGDFQAIHATEADGEPAIAVLVIENDEGDAVTEESQAWGYLSWPAEVDEDTPAEAPVHINVPVDEAAATDVRWTDQGVIAGNQLLKPGATAFEQVNVAPEPVVIGDYDLGETLVGVSGDTFLSYATGVAYTEGGGEDGDTYVGWVARGADGTQVWDNLEGTPNQGDSLFGEGPSRMPLVVGDYALTVIPTDETYTAYELQWLDAAGKPATPKPDDLVGAEPRGGAAAIMTNDVAALLSPSGKHLFVYWSTLALVIEVEAGTVTWVDSDFEITGDAIDDTTVYGHTENGPITIDLAAAKATPQKEGATNLTALGEGYGVIVSTDDVETIAVAPLAN